MGAFLWATGVMMNDTEKSLDRHYRRIRKSRFYKSNSALSCHFDPLYFAYYSCCLKHSSPLPSPFPVWRKMTFVQRSLFLTSARL